MINKLRSVSLPFAYWFDSTRAKETKSRKVFLLDWNIHMRIDIEIHAYFQKHSIKGLSNRGSQTDYVDEARILHDIGGDANEV